MEQKENEAGNDKGFTLFAVKKIIIGVAVAVLVLWASGKIIEYVTNASSTKKVVEDTQKDEHLSVHPKEIEPDTGHGSTVEHKQGTGTPHAPVSVSEPPASPPAHSDALGTVPQKTTHAAASHAEPVQPPPVHEVPKVTGHAFVTATIKPLEDELERFWGWRPNDIPELTDNVNNFQLGVLEITQRTVDKLTENISRIGSTSSLDKDLELARRTCFAIKADRKIPPRPESRYREGMKKLRAYRDRLQKGEAGFYTRTDNLIPLLIDFESQLGSCDDKLVRQTEENGKAVSFFDVDEYFFYAQGVASAMATVLTAVHEDFHAILETRSGAESLHHAIESLHHATDLSPLVILDSDYDGLTANHRANMAAHISHARFYLGVLIKTLST